MMGTMNEAGPPGLPDLALALTGADYSMWLLHGNLPDRGEGVPWRRGAEGAILTAIDGVLDTPSELRRRAAARQHGSTPGTRRFDERKVPLEVVLQPTAERSLDEVAAAWRRAWDGLVLLTALTPSGPRVLRLLSAQNHEPDLERAPHRRKFLRVAVDAVAPDPFATQVNPSSLNVTVPASGEVTLTLDNPADFECWPRFTCSPGAWELPDGVSGELVPLADSDGASFQVDTAPGVETVRITDREDGWRLLLGRGFRHPLPARMGSRTVTVKGPPGGNCVVWLERRWTTLW